MDAILFNCLLLVQLQRLYTLSTGTLKGHYSLAGVTVNQSILVLLARDTFAEGTSAWQTGSCKYLIKWSITCLETLNIFYHPNQIHNCQKQLK